MFTDEFVLEQWQDAVASPASTQRQNRVDIRVREHPVEVGSPVLVRSGEVTQSIQRVAPADSPQAQVVEGVLDLLDVGLIGDYTARTDQSDRRTRKQRPRLERSVFRPVLSRRDSRLRWRERWPFRERRRSLNFTRRSASERHAKCDKKDELSTR